MGIIPPRVDSCEEDDSRRGVTHERKLAPELGHPQSSVEDIAEELLLVGRREVLNLPANARWYFGRHTEGRVALQRERGGRGGDRGGADDEKPDEAMPARC